MLLCFVSCKSVFQFHKGTIKTSSAPYITATDINFNSIKVQLKRFTAFVTLTFDNFNSIKVQLKPTILSLLLNVLLHFNSIKVQLKQSNIVQLIYYF